MSGTYKAFNGPAPTAAAVASVASGTTIKTMLQLKNTKGMLLTGWGYSLDTEQAAAGEIELIATGIVAATVTPFAAGDVTSLGTPSTTSGLTLGASASGYTASAEGAITATDPYDVVRLPISTTSAPHMTYVRRFASADNDAPYIAPGTILRVRATTGTSAGMTCWVSWIEYT